VPGELGDNLLGTEGGNTFWVAGASDGGTVHAVKYENPPPNRTEAKDASHFFSVSNPDRVLFLPATRIHPESRSPGVPGRLRSIHPFVPLRTQPPWSCRQQADFVGAPCWAHTSGPTLNYLAA